MRCRGTGGAEAFEGRRGFLIGALRQGDAALEAHENRAGLVEGFTQRDAVGAAGADGVIFPEVRLDAEEPAQRPLIADEGIDEESVFRRGGEEAVEVPGL